ncbi:transposase, partial [Acinetobacter baumannii]
LLHGQETDVFADAGYQGADKRAESDGKALWHVAMRPGMRKALPDTRQGRRQERIESMKASLRALVEHPFHVIKNRFGHRKVRYRGLR